MAVSAGFAVRLLGGDLEFTAGGMDVAYLIGTFVKSIEDTGSHIEITLQRADGTEHAFTWTGGAAPAGSGWTPQLAAVSDGDRRVLQVADWEGGTGVKPPTGQYVGPMGLVADAASAVDIRGTRGVAGVQGPQGGPGQRGLPGGDGNPGADGDTGWSPVLSVASDGDRRVLQVHSWTGGTGTPPAHGQYLGAAGLVSDIADGADIRGPLGTAAGSIGRTEARADIGFPHYIAATMVYDAAAHTITATVTGVASPFAPMFLYLAWPTNLDRQHDPLRLIVGSENRRITDLNNNPLGANDLTPGQLASVLTYAADAFRLIEPLPPRPQDFVIHMFAFFADNINDAGVPPNYADPTHTLTQALVDNATYHTMSASDEPWVLWPNVVPSRAFGADPPGIDAYDEWLSVVFYWAVPDDAPNIRAVQSRYVDSRRWSGSFDSGVPADRRVAGTFNIGGVAHKFVRGDYGFSPDFTDDPPTDWELPFNGLFDATVVGFEGRPDPDPAAVNA